MDRYAAHAWSPDLTNTTSEPSVDERDFKSALALFASGVTVITTRDSGGAIHGMTATAFCSLSLDPPLILVAIARETRCHANVMATERFGVSVLAATQIDLSRHFGGKPNATPVFEMFDDVPVVEGALMHLSCNLEAPRPGGDHSIFVGRVTAARSEPGTPLIHFEGRYRRLDHDVA